MSKQNVHFAAFGYEPMRMKPVHFANGFFLALIGSFYRLEWLNKAAVIKNKKGLIGDYTHSKVLEYLKTMGVIGANITEENIKVLRIQLNGILDNDEGMYAAFPPYKTFGNDYTVISDHFLTSGKRLDGYSGYFMIQVLKTNDSGRKILDFALRYITNYDTPLERFVSPLLKEEEERMIWNEPYTNTFGELTQNRLNEIANIMSIQTEALVKLCNNLEYGFSIHSKLRYLVIGLCCWLFIYIQKYGRGGNPLLFMDFMGGKNKRLRSVSRNSFSRQREMFFGSYKFLKERGLLLCDEEDFELFTASKDSFNFLDQHFSDLAVRIGFAQPRAPQVKLKHFELQPDTIRVLLMSLIDHGTLLDFEQVANKLREVWDVCFGACSDEQLFLRKNGILGLDMDEDLIPNSIAFVNILKKLNLATELSDGLVVCSSYPEELL